MNNSKSLGQSEDAENMSLTEANSINISNVKSTYINPTSCLYESKYVKTVSVTS